MSLRTLNGSLGMKQSRSNPFRTPSVSFDYGPVIEAMARCREEVERLTLEYGNRTPVRREAEAVLADLDGLGKLLPVTRKSVLRQCGACTRRDKLIRQAVKELLRTEPNGPDN